MKYLLSILIIITYVQFSYAENDRNKSKNNECTDTTGVVCDKQLALNTITNLEYDFPYQTINNELLNLDPNSDNYIDVAKIKKKKRRRHKKSRSGAIDNSLIYFSVGTGVLILTPTILSAVDKDVSVGGALAADFIMAGILTYAILKER